MMDPLEIFKTIRINVMEMMEIWRFVVNFKIHLMDLMEMMGP